MNLHQARGAGACHRDRMEITFPGGMRVEAVHDGFRVATDQPASHGGGGTAPSPFDLFLVSIGTCAGFYALRFCQQRGLDTGGLSLRVTPHEDPMVRRVVRIEIAIALPILFPERYREAIVRAVEQCTVKRHLLEPPRFDISAFPSRREEPVAAEAVLTA
jgi:ribosomal protein S12 methylthiotransferase accessory factor